MILETANITSGCEISFFIIIVFKTYIKCISISYLINKLTAVITH